MIADRRRGAKSPAAGLSVLDSDSGAGGRYSASLIRWVRRSARSEAARLTDG